jgi:hypothetical protein
MLHHVQHGKLKKAQNKPGMCEKGIKDLPVLFNEGTG